MILVLTPTLGTSVFLDETCASVAAISLPKRHILICPAAKVSELGSRFPACEVVADAGVAGGMYGALNAGLAAAGDDWSWFTYINDDDRLGSEFASFAEKQMRAADERVIGYGDVCLLDESGRRLGLMSVEKNSDRFVALLDAGLSPISQQGMFFSRAVVREIGVYRPQWRLCSDQDFWLRALRAGFGFRYHAGEVGCFRLRRGQLSSDVAKVEIEMAAITREQFPAMTSPATRRWARWLFRARNVCRIGARISRTGWRSSASLLGGDAKKTERPVFINGLGCLESGARVVLRDLLRAYPADAPRGILVMPAANRLDIDVPSARVRVIALNHRIFGRWLRPLYEAGVWGLAKLGAFSRVVNLSHYGWCPGGNYVLYFHNELLITDGHEDMLGRAGRPNGFKRWCLRTCLSKAERVVVQTERIAARIREYAGSHQITRVPLEVVVPRCEVTVSAKPAAKAFPFTFFYPTSGFAHKRPELAIAGVIEANRRDPRVGLVITLPKPNDGEAAACITYSGTLTREEVMAVYASSDALLFTSSHETLGLPLLEALSFGLPAVLPELDYARDVYGAAGSYFGGNSTAGVAEAILACVRDREALAARTGEQRVLMDKTSRSWAEHWSIFGVKGS